MIYETWSFHFCRSLYMVSVPTCFQSIVWIPIPKQSIIWERTPSQGFICGQRRRRVRVVRTSRRKSNPWKLLSWMSWHSRNLWEFYCLFPLQDKWINSREWNSRRHSSEASNGCRVPCSIQCFSEHHSEVDAVSDWLALYGCCYNSSW